MRKALVVDDSELIRKVLSNYLEENGFNVVVAVDGKDALEKIEKNSDLSIMFFDIVMPEMNGLHLCDHVRNQLNIKDIPIIILTSEVSPDAKDRAHKLGANAWIRKPFKKENVEAVLKNIFKEDREKGEKKTANG